jgi:hypothetical protein
LENGVVVAGIFSLLCLVVVGVSHILGVRALSHHLSIGTSQCFGIEQFISL